MNRFKSRKRVSVRILGISAFLLFSSVPAYAAFDTAVIDWAIGELCGHIMGHLGGLLVTIAAVGALISAAMGSYRVFYGAIITAVGAFATSAIMSLYFDKAAGKCTGGQGGGGAAPSRVLEPAERTIEAPGAGNDPFDSAD